MSEIKAELRLIREQRPDDWENIKIEFCPNEYNSQLEDDKECQYSNCEECWDKAIESEC